MIFRSAQADEPQSVASFRDVIYRHGNGDFGLGDDYGTLVLSYLNCPDNLPAIIHFPSNVALFPRAPREGQ